MGKYARLHCRPRPAHFNRKEKKVIQVDVDWQALAVENIPEGMEVDLKSVKILQTLNLSASDVNSVAIGKNFVLATGAGDKRIQVCKWVPESGFTPAEYSPLKDHKYTVSCVDFSPYGTILSSASVDGNTILWDTTNGDKLTSFVQPGNSSVRVCQFSPKATLLLTAGDCGGVHLWDVSTRSLIRTFSGHEEAVYAASFTPDESYLVSGCSAGLLFLWDGTEKGGNKPLASHENAHDLGITCLTFAPNLVASRLIGKEKILLSAYQLVSQMCLKCQDNPISLLFHFYDDEDNNSSIFFAICAYICVAFTTLSSNYCFLLYHFLVKT